MRGRVAGALAGLVLAGPVLAGPVPGGPGARAGAADPVRAAAGEPVLRLPQTVVAGEDVAVGVAGVEPGAAVRVLAVTGLGQQVADVVADEDGAARLVLDAPVTRQAGLMSVLVTSGGGVAEGVIDVRPGPVEDAVQTVVGARTIVADDADLAMAVAIPVDAWGNAPLDGTPVTVHRVRPNGVTEQSSVQVGGLLAWAEMFSGTVAGTGRVWTSLEQSEEVVGPATSLVEVPAPPRRFGLRLVGTVGAPVADGRSLIEVRTPVLRDRFGNVQLDGTAVTVTWTGTEGAGSTVATTVGGIARVVLQAPSRPGRIVVRATSRGTRSGALRVDLGAAVDALPAVGRWRDGLLEVTVGPLRRTGAGAGGGALLDDGTPVDLVVRTSDGPRVVAGQLVDGRATLTVPVTRDGSVRVRSALVRVLGVGGSVDLTAVDPTAVGQR